MRLIAERDEPVRDLRIPPWPNRRALDGTEHSAVRLRIENTIFPRYTEPLDLFKKRPRVCGANHRDLPHPDQFPLLEQMAEH
jgi:hypothetical protein